MAPTRNDSAAVNILRHIKLVGNVRRADSQHAMATTTTNVTIHAANNKPGFLWENFNVGSWNKNRATTPNVKSNWPYSR